MKVFGWVYSSLDINHGQHSYDGTIKKSSGKVKVGIDLGHITCQLKGKTSGKCVVQLPKVSKPKESVKQSDPEYYKKLYTEYKTFKTEYKNIVLKSFAEIKEAAKNEGLSVDAMKLKIK